MEFLVLWFGIRFHSGFKISHSLIRFPTATGHRFRFFWEFLEIRVLSCGGT